MLPKNRLLILTGIFLTGILFHSVYRDIQLGKQYPGDLRNRVVGARLQKDRKLPYFYYWTPEDGTRYWLGDSCNQVNGTANKITASPFFHELLFPICDFSFLTISRIWMLLEYIMLGSMIWMFCCFTADRSKKILFITAGILFTATEAWKLLILEGQLYFFVAFLMCCIIAGPFWNKRSLILFAGIGASAFVLTRPIALVIFIPFIFQYKKYLLFLATAFVGLVIYGLFVLLNPSENALWKDYTHALKVHVAYHQNEDLKIKMTPCPPVSHLEGFDFTEIKKSFAEHPIHMYTENGNVFVIYNLIFHKKMPLNLLNTMSALTVILLTGIFFYFFRKHKPLLLQTLIFALTLYMLVEIFNPIHRAQYNTVQWFPMVLSGFLFIPIRDWKKPAFLLLALGLALNISNISWILMRHTLGELCWLAGLLLIVFSTTANQIQWKKL